LDNLVGLATDVGYFDGRVDRRAAFSNKLSLSRDIWDKSRARQSMLPDLETHFRWQLGKYREYWLGIGDGWIHRIVETWRD
jgi:hypothetical protein